MAFEKYLVDYCSPTLASVKTANLFNWFYAVSYTHLTLPTIA